jgi:hypothetical protein
MRVDNNIGTVDNNNGTVYIRQWFGLVCFKKKKTKPLQYTCARVSTNNALERKGVPGVYALLFARRHRLDGIPAGTGCVVHPKRPFLSRVQEDHHGQRV